jgi:hypothetical protein
LRMTARADVTEAEIALAVDTIRAATALPV